MKDGWITWRRTDRQIEMYTYTWLHSYLHVMCHLKDLDTYWVPPLNEYLDISTYKYALGIGLFNYGRLSTKNVNVCFESTRTPCFNCIPCVTGIILWHDENCCKQVCRQKINFHLPLSYARFSLDNDKKSQDYVYGEWYTMVIWIIKPGILRPVFKAICL